MDTFLKGYALKKAKRKQLFKNIYYLYYRCNHTLIPIFYKVGNYFAAKKLYESFTEKLFLHNAIAEPNIQIDSQVTSS